MMNRKLNLKNVVFTGRDQAEASPGWPHWVVISISEPDAPPAALQNGWHSVLRLDFHDIDHPEEPYLMFTIDQANQIIEFAELVAESNQIEGILVHCRAGVSRSAAVAKWLSERYSLPFPETYTLYNKHVYRILREARFDRQMGGR